MTARGRWWPDLPETRLAPLRDLFARVVDLPYDWDEAKGGYDFWRRAVETWEEGFGDCEDKCIAYLDGVASSGQAEAMRLAIVDSGTRELPAYQQEVDGTLMTVPGVDHAAILWLPDVGPDLDASGYADAWRSSREICVDPTWDWVTKWALTGFALVWSWGIQGGVGRWRKHFE